MTHSRQPRRIHGEKLRECGQPSRPTLLAIVLGASLSFACQSPTYVPDAKGTEAISATAMTCSRPYELPQDCSSWSGATREIAIGDVNMKIAGSSDGRIVLLSGPRPNVDTLKGSHTQITNFAYEIVKSELVDAGLEIVKVEPVASMGSLYGYVIELDGDAYSVLRAHSID